MFPDMRRDTVKLGNLLSIAEQIQAFGLGRKTGEIYITNVPPPARLNLVDGEIVDAQFGLRSGIEAAVALINLPDPQTEFIVGERAQRRTITIPYMEVLCEAARIRDETKDDDANRITEPIRLAPTNPYLRITMGTEIKTFPIRPGLAFVGRSTANDIVINDSTISQRHASIEYSRSGVFLKDLGSTNGTYVAGQPIKERWLGVQDSIQFGGVHCLYIGGLKKAPY
ncbi:MAG TPA: FHA domain-containing protein [Candidatus Methylacidiphilales bacterium]|nr:FHA domain-containing protein [Candidatus Methylacidiphilales bacterium]